MSRLLEGRALAETIQNEAAATAGRLKVTGPAPTLAIVVATDNQDAAWYVRSIGKRAEAAGIDCRVRDLGPSADTEALAAELTRLAADDTVHGIILQVPLPAEVDIDALLPLIPVNKDIDGASPESAGRLVYGLPCFAPATAEAVTALLAAYDVPVAGRQAVVVGRSRVVGKPVAHLLLARDATVTICHTKTADLTTYTRSADILVVAAGHPGTITPDHVSENTTVIDVGTTVNEKGEVVGDVAPETAEACAGLTPVPGGVGPVTTALLLRHTVLAAERRFA